MKAIRILSLLLVLALTVALVPACVVVTKDKILVIGTTDSPTTLDPADAYDYFSSNVLFNVAETLVAYGPGTSEIVPCLATEWSTSADGLEYTFTIREGVKFSDGTALDANAVKFSLDRARSLGGDPGFLLGDIDRIEVTGDYAVKIVLKNPCSPFLSKLGYTVADIISPAAYTATEKNPTAIVGTGPYVLQDWVEADHLTLVRNPEYWGTPAFADKVVTKFYANSASLKLALENAEVDVAYRSFVPLEESALAANGELVTVQGPSPSIRYLVINVTKKPFNNVAVRKAIALAVDRDEISETVFAGTVTPLYSMVPDGMWSMKPVFQTATEPDIAGAQAELTKAGYSEAKPLTFQFWYTPTHYGETEADLAQVLKKQFEATGMMRVELQSSEWGRYTDDLVAGSMGILLLGWYPDYFDPDDYVFPFLSTEGAKSMGSFYSSQTMDGLLVEEVALTTVEERTPVLEEIQDLLAQDMPNIPLYQRPQFVAFRKNVKGVILDPLQIFRYYLITKDEWK